MRKVIGLIPLFDEQKESYWMLPGYMKVIQLCGALPVMLTLTTDKEALEECLQMCDGLLLTGGHDVDPGLYHEKALPQCGVCCRERDEMEAYLLEGAYKMDKPVFGICRGIQFMNVLFGGTLYQDLPSQYDSQVEHHMSPPYDVPVHEVTVLKDTLLADILGSGTHKVNSYHHQAIRDLAPEASAMAISEDGLVEAIRIRGKRFIVGVQWHPEFAYQKDGECRKLVQAFVDACI